MQNSSMLSTILFGVVVIAIVYVIFQYLYPAEDPTYTQFLEGDADARKPVLLTGKMPEIHTGGDFTLSLWLYVDDFNYMSANYKHLFSIEPETPSDTSKLPLVAVLTPITNGLMVRAAVSKSSGAPAPGSAASPPSSAAPDITVAANLKALISQQTSMNMFDGGIDPPCDIKEVPLQRWVNVTIVSSGRVLDVYMDGKLSRSCVLDGVVYVPRGKLRLNVCSAGGFGGRVSTIQMWGYQLTPDVIYTTYQMGPVHYKHDLFSMFGKYLNLNVSFTGATPGQPITNQGSNIFNVLSAAQATALQDVQAVANCGMAQVMTNRM